jgi:uncharacterized protein YfaP (DUF2135 family)
LGGVFLSPGSDEFFFFESAIKALDEALDSIAQTEGKTTSKVADEKLDKATEKLGEYDRKYCFKEGSTEYKTPDKTFLKRMEEAKSKDKSRTSLLSKLKAVFQKDEPTFRVDFQLQEPWISPLDRKIVVHREC